MSLARNSHPYVALVSLVRRHTTFSLLFLILMVDKTSLNSGNYFDEEISFIFLVKLEKKSDLIFVDYKIFLSRDFFY